VAVVSVTAGAENPLPPLVLAVDWKLILLVLGTLVALSGACAQVATRRLR
jgi:hypothetical protein